MEETKITEQTQREWVTPEIRKVELKDALSAENGIENLSDLTFGYS